MDIAFIFVLNIFNYFKLLSLSFSNPKNLGVHYSAKWLKTSFTKMSWKQLYPYNFNFSKFQNLAVLYYW